MKTKAEIAAEEYHGKFNCAQSTLAQFAEDYGLDEKTALRLGAAFGGGCHYGSVCGAVAGCCAVIGLRYGNDEHDPDKYNFNRDMVREFVGKFKDKHGAVNCSDLLGIDMSEPGGRDLARSQGLFDSKCREYIRSSVEILEELGY